MTDSKKIIKWLGLALEASRAENESFKQKIESLIKSEKELALAIEEGKLALPVCQKDEFLDEVAEKSTDKAYLGFQGNDCHYVDPLLGVVYTTPLEIRIEDIVHEKILYRGIPLEELFPSDQDYS